MDLAIKNRIEQDYGLQIHNIEAAPRTFVAETWFITTNLGKYFVKVVDKQLFIPEIIRGLPALNAMHKAGIERINSLVHTTSGELHIMHDAILIALFNVIEAEQSYEYSEAALGELIASINQITPKIDVFIPEETYEYEYKQQFESQLDGILSGQLATDPILADMQEVLKTYQERISMQYSRFSELTKQMKELNLPKVITHGDAGGNTLMKSPTDVYLIDWDSILLAPAERDMWVPTHDFLDGYRKVIPNFEPNKTSLDFYTLMYYFRALAQYFAEIISDKSEEHRKKNLDGLENTFSDGWMLPYLKKADAL